MVRGCGPYRPYSSVKYPSLGIAFAAGWVQSFDVETFDMWLLFPIGQSSAKRAMWARHGTGGALHSEGCRRADGVVAENVPPMTAPNAMNYASFRRMSGRSDASEQFRLRNGGGVTMRTGVTPIGTGN